MKLVKLTTFKDKFFGNAEFDFDDEHINTISGKILLENGYEKYNKLVYVSGFHS
ncbi:MAG: hypothetical protein HFJ10_03765 [Lachnospiraceae bacterium]|nr:hypothetical protein [Lachnospiraceae bacterium]